MYESGRFEKEEGLLMKEFKGSWRSIFKRHKQVAEEEELNQGIYQDIVEAQSRWEEARMYFEEALGEDQVDYAIYMLEAAERKYQMHLKKAKNLGIHRLHLSGKSK
jgi:hypothetical protein